MDPAFDSITLSRSDALDSWKVWGELPWNILVVAQKGVITLTDPSEPVDGRTRVLLLLSLNY